jgi:O-antigen ligase
MAFVLLNLFTISYFLHLTARVPALGALRLDLALAGGAMLAIAIQYGVGGALRLSEEVARRLNLFLVYILVSLPLVTWPGSVINNSTEWIKVVFFFLLVVGAIRSEKQLKILMLVFLACQLFRGLEPLYLHITTGYWGDIAYSHAAGVMTGLNRLSGAPFDVVNPNQLAWVIVSTIPFLFYLLWQLNKKGRLLFVIIVLPLTQALLLTGSRSGLLSLAMVIVAIIMFSKNRKRTVLIGLFVIVPIAVILLGQLAPDMQERYLSLIDSDVAGADTKQGRINALVEQIGTVSNNPLFGHGLGTSGETNWNIMGGSSQITHNLYVEILQETGAIGLTLFLLYIATIIKSLRRTLQTLAEKGYAASDWLVRLSSAALVWVIMDLFYSMSCFGLRSWEWYFFGGIATVCHILALERKELISAEPSYA